MRIGTWNVEYAYVKRLQALHDALSANPADIWILTETHDELRPDSCPFVAHTLPRPKNWSGIREGSHWASVWSRYPVIEQIALPGSDGERTVAVLLQVSEREQLLVYGTVMPWKGDREKFDWSEHHRVVPEQCAEWAALRERFPQASICVAGDYNTDMASGGYYGTKQGIAAINAGLVACDLYCATTPPLLPADILPYPLIDHIAVPEAWRSRTRVVAAWPANKAELSDHSGVVIEVV